MPCGVFYGHLVYFKVVWYIFSHFGKIYTEKNLATLNPATRSGISFNAGAKQRIQTNVF
jgi:hypothetical protein